MVYPILGESFLIGRAGLAVVAILLVFVAHATAGLGFISATFHRRALRTGNPLLFRFLPRCARYATLIPTVLTMLLTMITWIYAMLVIPTTVSAIAHLFMWPLMILGLAFVVQGLAAYTYMRSTKLLHEPRLLKIVWIYTVCTFVPVVIISLITSFMTTPGDWIESFQFWDAFVNPTFIPSVILNGAWMFALGSVAMMLIANVVSGLTYDERHDIEKASGKWLWAIIAVIPFAILYLMSVHLDHAAALLCLGVALTSIVLIRYFLSQVLRNDLAGLAGSLTLALILLGATASFDLAQVKLRSPYSIYGYIYANGLMVADKPQIAREGLLSKCNRIVPRGLDLARIPDWKRGQWVFEALRYEWYMGRNAKCVSRRIYGLNRDAVRNYFEHIDRFSPAIPPFMGTPQELDDLTAFILYSSERRTSR